MLVVSNGCNEYIDNITLNFIEYTHGVKRLMRIEKKRQEKSRLEILSLIKLYKGMELSKKEKDALGKHMFQYDLKTDLNRCICQVVYEISDKIYSKVFYINLDNMRSYGSAFDNSGYNDYLDVLKKYRDSLLHAMCYNHNVVLNNPKENKEVRPVMDFDSDCFIDKEIKFVKKRTLN